MAEIRTEIEINAPVDKVYNMIADLDKYPNWNPLVVKAEGAPYEGADLTITIRAPLGLDLPLGVTVKTAAKNTEFRWVGSAPVFDFLMTGDHYFRFEKISDEKTKFIHGEIFTGLLEPLVGDLIVEQGTPLYENLNYALKARCEQG